MKALFNREAISFNLRFLVLCILAGVGSALFSLLTDKAYIWCMGAFNLFGYMILIYIPAIFILIVHLLKNYFPYAGGSGLPQGYALDVFEEDTLKHTYSIPTMIGKVGLTFLSILGGASLGREGPTIQICASIFASMKNISERKRKLLIQIGSGVGVATAFNAPLGGIIFAIEEYIKHSNTKMNILLLSGIAIAGYFTTVVSGDYSYMGNINVDSLYYSVDGVILALIGGIVCGLTGALFTYLIVRVSVNHDTWFCNFRNKHYLWCAGIFGFIVALIGIYSQGLSFGNGALTVKGFLNDNTQAPVGFALYKALGAISSVAAGVPGGYFSTALSIGAGVMTPFHDLFHSIPMQQLYLIGMVGFLAAITNAPITAVVMVMSIVSDTQHFALPLILSSVLSAYIASLFGESVYHQQILIYVDKEKYALLKNKESHLVE